MKLINKSSFDTELLEFITDVITSQIDHKPKQIIFSDLKHHLFKGQLAVNDEIIKVRINHKDFKFPLHNYYNRRTKNINHYNGYLDFTFLSKYEILIWVLSHELRHLWQKYNRKNKDKWTFNSYGKFSNKDADSFAKRQVRTYRKMINQYVYMTKGIID